jgi:hypothetical protein
MGFPRILPLLSLKRINANHNIVLFQRLHQKYQYHNFFSVLLRAVHNAVYCIPYLMFLLRIILKMPIHFDDTRMSTFLYLTFESVVRTELSYQNFL